MSRFLMGMITGAILMLVAMHYHIVRSDDGFHLVPKISNNLSDVYVDIRDFDLDDWQQHKPLAAAVMRSSQSHLLEDASYRSFRSTIGNLMDGLFGSEVR